MRSETNQAMSEESSGREGRKEVWEVFVEYIQAEDMDSSEEAQQNECSANSVQE